MSIVFYSFRIKNIFFIVLFLQSKYKTINVCTRQYRVFTDFKYLYLKSKIFGRY